MIPAHATWSAGSPELVPALPSFREALRAEPAAMGMQFGSYCRVSGVRLHFRDALLGSITGKDIFAPAEGAVRCCVSRRKAGAIPRPYRSMERSPPVLSARQRPHPTGMGTAKEEALKSVG